jgi:hypothetical protein
MQSEQQPSKQPPSLPDAAGPVTVSDKYVGYLLLFAFLLFLLYIIPEVLVFKQSGFAPTEHLVDTGTSPTLSDIFSSLWTDRAQLLNPMNNSLVRFFLVTMIVGVVFDRVKKHSPATGERS